MCSNEDEIPERFVGMFGILLFFIFTKLIYLQCPREKLLEQNAVGEGDVKEFGSGLQLRERMLRRRKSSFLRIFFCQAVCKNALPYGVSLFHSQLLLISAKVILRLSLAVLHFKDIAPSFAARNINFGYVVNFKISAHCDSVVSLSVSSRRIKSFSWLLPIAN